MTAMILKGVPTSPYSVVGTNAVVTKSYPEGSVIAENPAHMINTSEDFLKSAQEKSLVVGHLFEMKKHRAYREIFGIE